MFPIPADTLFFIIYLCYGQVQAILRAKQEAQHTYYLRYSILMLPMHNGVLLHRCKFTS